MTKAAERHKHLQNQNKKIRTHTKDGKFQFMEYNAQRNHRPNNNNNNTIIQSYAHKRITNIHQD